MAPVQLVVLPVTDAQMPAAAALVRRCVAQGLRAELAAAAASRTHALSGHPE